MIFTTAELWTSSADISNADLTDGRLEAEDVDARPVEWLWFVHNRSPHLLADVREQRTETDLASTLRQEFSRAVAIVGPDGLV